MSKFLNSIALLPMLGFIVTMIYILLSKEEVYTNYHWFVVALLSLQASAERLKNANSVSITIFVSSILANILLLIASGFDLKITPTTLGLFIGYLSIGFLIVKGNLAINWYMQLSANKASKSDS